MENTGHEVKMRFHYPNQQKATITGKIVNDGMYIVDHVSFRWGENDT